MRVLFCGLGGIGQRHLRNLRTLIGADRLDVHAYRVLGRSTKLRDDLSVDAGRDLTEDYGVTVHRALDDALAARPTVVFVCNPTNLHVAVGLQAAMAGAHVFIEKPLSSSMDGVAALDAAVRRHQRIGYVGYHFRFHPALRRLKAVLDEGRLGRILAAHAEIGEYLPHWHRYEDYRSMYAARAELGGGVILTQIHEMDLICWFFGLPESICTIGGKLSSLEVDVEDTASSLIQATGPLGRFPITLHQDYLQRPPTRRFKVIGDRGIAHVDLVRNRLAVLDADGRESERWDDDTFKRNDMFLEQMKHFLACTEGRETPEVSISEGTKSLRLALAARQSLALNSVVRLDGSGR